MTGNNAHRLDERLRTSKNGNTASAMPGELENRVKQLETCINEIKQDLTIIRIHAENFSTKSDLLELASVAKSDQLALKIELYKSTGDILKEISGQTKWIMSLIITIAALTLTAAKLLC